MRNAKDFINLLPVREKGPFPRVRTALLLAMPFVLLWVAAFGLQVKRAWDLRSEQASLVMKQEELARELAGLQKELGPAAALGFTRQKDLLIRDLLNERVLWSEVFKQFSRIVPRGIWFDSLEGSSPGRTEVKIKGGAFNYQILAQFMHALDKSAFFMNPQLRYAQKTVVRGRDSVRFEILCETRRGETEK